MPLLGARGGETVRFRVLGPIEIQTAGQPIEIRGRFQRTLLAALVINAGRLVMGGALVDELWGETPPSAAENALQAHVSRLRAKLAAAEPNGSTPRITSLPTGYRLMAEAHEIDAEQFLRAVVAVRARQDLLPAETIDLERETVIPR